MPTLADASERIQSALGELTSLRERLIANSPKDRDSLARIDALSQAFSQSAADAAALVRRLTDVCQTANRLFVDMDFSFLFDSTQKLFSIGYRATDGSLDSSYYDLLASEARLTSFIAVAKGDVPSSHWFRLGRALTPVGRGSALISWSGSMFEYLMPASSNALTRGQYAEPNVSSGGAPPNRIWNGTQRSLGNFRVSIQRS